MRNHLMILLFISLFCNIFSPIPVWDLSKSSIDLLLDSSSSEIPTYQSSAYDITVTLIKKIIKTGDDITTENLLTVNGETEVVDFEKIDSHYANRLGCDILICPKGKFHPYDFNNKQFIIPTGFEEKGGWDLRCYDHLTGIFFIFYLMNRSKNAYCYSNGNIKECFSINTIYDFILENGNNDENYRYSFPYFYNNGVLGLTYGSLKINAATNEISMYFSGNMNYHQRKSFSKVYFDKDSFFYYFSCNSVSDFISGYSNSIISFSSFPTISNTDSSLSPFNFIDEVSIKGMGLIAGTKYVYYKIYNIN